jgi:apolipoprotein N-acyltransferase
VGHAVASPAASRPVARFDALSLALACLSGVLATLSFPPFGIHALGWVALAPLLFALAWPAPSAPVTLRAFVLGLLAGAVYFGGTVYWTGEVMARYGGISTAVSAAIAALLVATLALFPAAFAIVLGHCLRRFGPRALLLAPAIWVTTEVGRTVVLGGFPWDLLGYSQTVVLPVAQMASVTGVYGVSALLVLASAALVLAALERAVVGWVSLGLVAAAIAGIAWWGSARLARGTLTRAGTPVTVGLVQGNVPQDEKWDPDLEEHILAKYLRMSGEAVDRGAELVLWPESATPFYFEESVRGLRIRQFARERRVWLLIGSDQFKRSVPPVSYNAAFMVRPDGTTAGVYQKVHLVPFGEYVPMRRALFFAAPLVEAVSDFAPGHTPVVLPFRDTRVSTAICYEVVYPALVRDTVRLGSTLLTTITNDAWFGRSPAPYQHFEMAAMRAIEEGRYLARAANTGISGFVDPYGRVMDTSDLFTDRVMVAQVRLIEAQTFYARAGDIVSRASVIVTIAALCAAAAMRKRGRAL